MGNCVWRSGAFRRPKRCSIRPLLTIRNSFERFRVSFKRRSQTKKPAMPSQLVQDQVQRNPKSPRLLCCARGTPIQAKQLEQAEASLNQILDLDNKMSPHSPSSPIASQNGQLEKGTRSTAGGRRLSAGHSLATRFRRPLRKNRQLAGGSVHLSKDSDHRARQSTGFPIISRYLYLEHGGNPNMALTLAQTASPGPAESSQFCRHARWAYYNNGGYSVAAPLLEGAVKATPANQTYRYHLASPTRS